MDSKMFYLWHVGDESTIWCCVDCEPDYFPDAFILDQQRDVFGVLSCELCGMAFNDEAGEYERGDI